MNRLVTLDLATCLGFTDGPAASRTFTFGSFALPKTGNDLGSFGAAFHDWLVDLLDQADKPELLVFESPILPKMTNIQTVRKLYGLAFLTELICKTRQIECAEENLMTVKKHFVGAGWATKTDMEAEAIRRGYAVTDDHQADAIGLRFLGLEKRWPAIARTIGDGGLGALGAAVR
jgi:Holliday junction resolvasome RuvABC endonuclease subunit